MPSSVRVKVVGARDLPEMDRTVRGEFCTDAYVDIKFRNYEQVKKQQCRGFHPDVALYKLDGTAPYIFLMPLRSFAQVGEVMGEVLF